MTSNSSNTVSGADACGYREPSMMRASDCSTGSPGSDVFCSASRSDRPDVTVLETPLKAIEPENPPAESDAVSVPDAFTGATVETAKGADDGIGTAVGVALAAEAVDAGTTLVPPPPPPPPHAESRYAAPQSNPKRVDPCPRFSAMIHYLNVVPCGSRQVRHGYHDGR